jgi:hypothetical protein
MRLMSSAVAVERARASRVAKWLVEKSRPEEAVLLLSAWAASGPNDTEGQTLLAEALRIDPSSKEAQLAFERMEGITGNHGPLEAAIAQYSSDYLLRLEAEVKKPSFRRAQMGFNNNIKSHGQVFHVQTEDSGLDAPHIITHLFADGGRVIKSHKRSYAAAVDVETDIASYVRGLMKAQHMEMVLSLRDGRFDGVIDGREIGGMDVLAEPPRDDIVTRIANGKRREARSSLVSPTREREPSLATIEVPAVATAAAPALYQLRVMRSLSGGPEFYAPTTDVAIIGSRGAVSLAGERFCHPEEAALTFRENRLFIEDLEAGNGVFVRIRNPVELEMGDEFIVGDQLLQVQSNPIPDDGPAPDPTYFYSSPKWPSSFRVVQLFEGGGTGYCAVARGNTLQVGSVVGDLLLGDDPLVDQQHCVVEEQAGTLVLTDLGSRTGLFVRIRGEWELHTGDEILVGRTRLRIEPPGTT